MTLALSERRAWVSQSEIRNMTIACERAGENLAHFCFAKEDPILDDACSRLERARF